MTAEDTQSEPQPASSGERRHDLDALRAVAMLLGIALHASLSFVAFPWIVQDSQQHELFGLFFAAIHGFRMPLFFLVSGFFTAMLWRKRGLQSLLKHRAKRILLPCLLGLITIVPLLGWVSERAILSASTVTHDDANGDVFSAVRAGNVAVVEEHISAGTDPDTPDSAFDITPLNWAALAGHADVAGVLLENGAKVEGRNSDGATALICAAFLGNAEVVELLISHGADVDARNHDGATAFDSTFADWPTTMFVVSLLKLPPVKQAEVEQGREEVRKLLGEEGSGDTPAAVEERSPEKTDREKGGDVRSAYAGLIFSDTFSVKLGDETLNLMTTPVFHHLWFLWFLCWMVPAFAVLAWIADSIGWRGLPQWLILSPARFVWLLPLTMIPQWFMGIATPGFGPDTSPGVIPQPHLLLYYGIFFAFGALYFDCDDQDGRLGGWWGVSLPLALFVALPAGIAMSIYAQEPFVGGVAQVVYVWAMTFGMIGLFRRLLSNESPVMRYVSDSSYWLYLAHLPLVIWAQAFVRDWPVSAFVKFPLLCIVTTAVLLLSYETLVRYTWLGTLLNGPRTRPQPVPVEDDSAS